MTAQENGLPSGGPAEGTPAGRSSVGAFLARAAHSASTSSTLLVTIALSASLTLLNKYIYDKLNFGYPFYLLSLHFGAIAIASRWLVGSARKKQLQEYSERVSWGFWSRNVLPVGLLYGGAILTSNLAYLFLSVSFVQMLKAFTPVVLVVVTALLDRELPPLRTALIVFTISCGVAIAAYGEIEFVLIGVIFQIIGSCCEVGRLIATQRLLQDLKVDPMVALSQLAPICFAMAILLAPIFEGLEPLALIVPRLGFFVIFFSVVLALTLNIVVLLLVSVTSALVLTLAGILKDICLITGSVFFLNSTVTQTQVFGYGVAALGLVYFRFGPGAESSTKPASSGKDEQAYEAVPLRPIDEETPRPPADVVFDAAQHELPPSPPLAPSKEPTEPPGPRTSDAKAEPS